jgi:hypothetical protein
LKSDTFGHIVIILPRRQLDVLGPKNMQDVFDQVVITTIWWCLCLSERKEREKGRKGRGKRKEGKGREKGKRKEGNRLGEREGFL